MSRLGSIGTQYFDDAGDPLISGFLYFFEPDSSTPKDTFADSLLTIANTNPVLLSAAGRQPNIFYSGSAKIIITDALLVQIEVRDPVGGESGIGGFPLHTASTIYNRPDIVVGSDGNFYVSLIDLNVNNDPVLTPTAWTQVRFIRVWNVNETYEIGQITEGSNGLLYSSATAGNIGNNPTGDAVNWKPATVSSVPPVIRAAGRTYAYRNF